MTARALHQLTAGQAAAMLKRWELSAEELTSALLARIAAVEPVVGAYLRTTAELALSQARKVDESRRAGADLPVLAGIPCALKDNLSTSGVPTTCCSRILEGYVPPYDATAWSRLKSAGAVLCGKTNMDEFAMGSSCENSAFKRTRNPWDTRLVPGGSSGGSAAAVAAGEALYALGSDTGGSVRQPAAFCGVVGLKPTYGLVSRYGLVAFGSSLDQIGPLTRDVTDCAHVMDAIAGHDSLDATSLPGQAGGYASGLEGGVKGLRIGIPREYFAEGVQPGVEAAVKRAIGVLVEQGAVAEECSLPHTGYALDVYYVIAPAEASANLARFDGVRYGLRLAAGDHEGMYRATRQSGFGPEVKRRIMIGTYVLSAGYYDAYYLKAQKVRTLVAREFAEAFARFDVLACPTTPTTAFPVGDKAGDPLAMYLSDVCTVPVNLAGVPALSVPCGLAGGLPVGLQLIGPALSERTLLRAAYTYEQASGGPLSLPEEVKAP